MNNDMHKVSGTFIANLKDQKLAVLDAGKKLAKSIKMKDKDRVLEAQKELKQAAISFEQFAENDCDCHRIEIMGIVGIPKWLVHACTAAVQGDDLPGSYLINGERGSYELLGFLNPNL